MCAPLVDGRKVLDSTASNLKSHVPRLTPNLPSLWTHTNDKKVRSWTPVNPVPSGVRTHSCSTHRCILVRCQSKWTRHF